MSQLFASTRRNTEFHELFKNIPQDELLIDSFSCALSREILIHGRLYISANYVCFNANILGWITNIVLKLRDVVSVEKKMTALIIPNGITVSTLHTRHGYASFLRRDDAYEKICQVWHNCLAEKPLPITELLFQLASGKRSTDVRESNLSSIRYRERKTSAVTDNGIDSIMSVDMSYSGDLDPALTVRREYNFGSSRQKSLSRRSIDALTEEKEMAIGGIVGDEETEEEQKEVRESILPCACAFHYKNTIIDQLILVPMPHILEGLFFTSKDMASLVPRAFHQALKNLGAQEINFSGWKVYLGKWERRVWSCTLPARKVLLSDSSLHLKVTDSVISRHAHKICVESLMQIDGVPGGGCFVKWKLCATSPNKENSPVNGEQCRITISAAAASPLGSWFKEAIRSALLQHTEEIWAMAIEIAAGLGHYSDNGRIDGKSGMEKSSSFTSDRRLIIPQNSDALGSVSLTYFDRKAFLKSITRITLSALIFIFVITVAVGIQRFRYGHRNLRNQFGSDGIGDDGFRRFSKKIHEDYAHFLSRNLKLPEEYPQKMMAISTQLEGVDGGILAIMGRVKKIHRQLVSSHPLADDNE